MASTPLSGRFSVEQESADGHQMGRSIRESCIDPGFVQRDERDRLTIEE